MQRGALLLIVVLARAAFADGDPPGTVTLNLVVGKSAPIATGPSANVLCDDLSVVTPEFAEGGFVLRALKAGSTLCGVWLAELVPGGLYRVNVTSAPDAPDAGPPPGQR